MVWAKRVPSSFTELKVICHFLTCLKLYTLFFKRKVDLKKFLVCAVGFGGLDFKLKCEGLNDAAVRHRQRYNDLDLSKSLMKNLEGQSLIEHPIIVISMKSHRHYFENGDSDGEQDQPPPHQPGTASIQREII